MHKAHGKGAITQLFAGEPGEKTGNPFLGRQFLVGQPPKKQEKEWVPLNN